MTKQELLEEIKDAEIKSLEYADIVYFDSEMNLCGFETGKIKSSKSMTKKEVKNLFDEMFFNEFGCSPKNYIKSLGL